MNVTFSTYRQNDKLIKYLISSQRELLQECKEDFKTQKFQDAVSRLRNKNKIQNVL
jgi:hypothetical protein